MEFVSLSDNAAVLQLPTAAQVRRIQYIPRATCIVYPRHQFSSSMPAPINDATAVARQDLQGDPHGRRGCRGGRNGKRGGSTASNSPHIASEPIQAQTLSSSHQGSINNGSYGPTATSHSRNPRGSSIAGFRPRGGNPVGYPLGNLPPSLDLGYLPPPPGLGYGPPQTGGWAQWRANGTHGIGPEHHGYGLNPPERAWPRGRGSIRGERGGMGRGRGEMGRGRGRGSAGRGHGSSGRGRGSAFGDQPSTGALENAASRFAGNPLPTWAERCRRGGSRGGSSVRGQGGHYSDFGDRRGRGRGRGEFRGGDGRGRGRGRGRGQAPHLALEELPQPRDIMQGILVPAMQVLMRPEVAIPDKPISIEDFRCIGSYTWLEAREPTIIVPGSPREWGDRSLPIKVYFDRGIRIYHEDKFRMGMLSPLLPLFRAVDTVAANVINDRATTETRDDHLAEPVDWPAIDFVTDRNNLRKLFRYISEPYTETASPTTTTAGSTSPSDHAATIRNDEDNTDQAATIPTEPAWDPRRDFRIDLHLAGQRTVLMERWAVFDREHITPPKGGCRNGFIQEATNPGCENGGGHFRIVQYNIGGLNMVVRWEVDACVPDKTDSEEASLSENATSNSDCAPVVTPVQSPTIDIDELARWEETDPGGAAAWGVAEESPATAEAWGLPDTPAVSTGPALTKEAHTEAKKPPKKIVDIDALARWEEDIGPTSTWDVPDHPARTSRAAAPCPIEQNPRAPAPAVAATWPNPGPVAEQAKGEQEDLAALWNDPANVDDGTAWGVGPAAAETDDPSPSALELKVIPGGALIPQTSLIELATRSAQYMDRTKDADTFIQLFLTQSPVNLVAVHTRGVFDRIVRQELGDPEFAKFGDDPEIQRKLGQFVALLREIQALVKRHGNVSTLSLVCQKGKLEAYSRMESEDVLLNSELARFTRQSCPE
ncbi:hypothetical protein C8Q73DRAFT_91624 [Cubamyces lactineus]|nr:hypothetical protein C8Q73DRAFT_91624 [Cubamyces lactineus]